MSGFNFGTTTLGSTATGGGFSFGAAGSAPATGTGGFSFGGLGAVTSNTTTAAATTTTSSSLSLGGGLFAQKPATGFSFNTPASGTAAATPTATSSTGFGLGFGKPAASASPFSLGNPAGSSTTTTAPVATGLTLSSIITASAPQSGSSTGFSLNLGGGGVTSSAPGTGLSLGSSLFSSSGGNTLVIWHNTHLKFVKEQKQVQEEISRMSYKAMLKVQDDIKSLKQLLSVSSSGLQRNALSIDKLKMETAQELKNADIALRTQKTPPGLQHENTAPSDYFRGLVEQFEVQLQQYRQQIEELENHLTTQSSGSHITPQGNLRLKTLKHQYLNYRRAFLDDSTDVFESKRSASRKLQSGPRVTTGPTPFGSVPNAAAVAMAATLAQQQQPAPGSQAGFGTPFASGMGASLGSSSLGAFGSGPAFGASATGGSTFGFSANKPSGGSLSAGFGSSNTSGFNFSNPGINASAGLTFGVSTTQNTAFGTGVLQLKKPPAGNKRGKR
ncbi:Nucleoporin p58/p45 [Bagarius yarrelli]|uniref:Nucleoporin p58/p45 n=1 Tax=Bagarius yarrelli TaxID=175774 RepID=A0A556TWT3_BAGYA|nr:Nucleoporin p58/p45 [Bagarius yarrelli]